MIEFDFPVIEKIRFEQLSFHYEGHDTLFDQVSFEFPANEIVRIHCDSGNGRSTLLQILAGLQMPTAGNYFLNDENISEMSFEEFLKFRMTIGFGFDYGGLINNRTIYENLVLPLTYHKLLPEVEAQSRVEAYMEEVGLLKYRDLRPSFIPGGMRKLACVVRAIIHHPQMLLLDDPSVGLGHDTADRIFDLILSLRSQGYFRHIFLSSYDANFLKKFPHIQVDIENTKLVRSERKGVASA